MHIQLVKIDGSEKIWRHLLQFSTPKKASHLVARLLLTAPCVADSGRPAVAKEGMPV